MKNGRAVPFFVNAQSTESTRVSGQSQAHTKQNRKYIPVDGYISYVVIEAPCLVCAWGLLGSLAGRTLAPTLGLWRSYPCRSPRTLGANLCC